MTDAELIDMVEKMRAAQKAYFKTRAPDTLTTSKALERQVDQAIAGRKTGALL